MHCTRLSTARQRLSARCFLSSNYGARYGTTSEGHPLIDVSALLDSENSNSRRAQTLKDMRGAFEEHGYFYAQNVNSLSQQYLESVYDYLQQAHALPLGVKKRFSKTKAYTGADVGEAELAYEPGSVATVRAWDYSRTRFTLASGDFDKERYPGVDVIQPDYVNFLDDLYERQNILGRGLMVAFAEMFDLPASTFTSMFEGDFGTIRLLSYPGNPQLNDEEAAAATDGISPHTDFEAFTLMHQDAPGLQFIPANKRHLGSQGWTDAPVRPGEFIVTCGDVLERFTNGVIKALPHRVIVTTHARSSIIRFNAVAAETVVEPLPQFVSESKPPIYSRVTMRTHMETTMRNLESGIGAWDKELNRSTTANYLYIDGKDHREFVHTP